MGSSEMRSYRATAEDSSNERQVFAVLNKVSGLIHDNAQLVKALHERLAPLTSPKPTLRAQTGDVDHDPDPALCPLADRIRDLSRLTSQTNDDLRELLSGLEI